MAFRAGLIFVVVALAATAAMALSSEHTFSFRLGVEPDGHGLVADAMDQLDEEMMMESDTVRRQLAQSRYISYGAMARVLIQILWDDVYLNLAVAVRTIHKSCRDSKF
ncbi:hypothetical protein BUALT_Bualt18G0048900 [Buddleja alternifolia]|uniref:Uncharacterized protein n=1 Tax=Buddleja alternifolia TaxID=168488 RepID=A0AAV6WD37_9LAMI|nr:hypothetical protein BUALT_Bualt18G0048900 [Buddleja alternifolia]